MQNKKPYAGKVGIFSGTAHYNYNSASARITSHQSFLCTVVPVQFQLVDQNTEDKAVFSQPILGLLL